MNELKDRWFWAYPTESVDCDGITGSAHEVYAKSEVDEVIAEKDAKIAELKEQVSEERSAKVDYKISANDMSDGLEKAYAEIKHHKYKRCLAMAKACAWEQRFWGDGIPAYERQFQWENRAAKWKKRWLELAEKFKEGK